MKLNLQSQKGRLATLLVAICLVSVLLGFGCKTPLPAQSGVFFGHYRLGFETSAFEPCDRKEKWWVNDNKLSDAMAKVQGLTNHTAYVEVRGRISEAGHFGHLGIYERELTVGEILIIRPPSDSDCK